MSRTDECNEPIDPQLLIEVVRSISNFKVSWNFSNLFFFFRGNFGWENLFGKGEDRSSRKYHEMES